MAMASACLLLFCAYERNNPIDPGADNYVGDESANDHTPPQVVVSIPPADTSVIDFDSVVVAGAVIDMGAGVDHIDVNGFIAIHDSTLAIGNATRVFWHATVYLQQDTTTLAIRAVDKSIHENDTTASKVVIRIRHPRAPSNVSARMIGDDVRVSWKDESLNETGFVIERRAGTDAFAAIDTVEANDTVFVDSAGPFQAHVMYAYRVVAINDAGRSEPSAAASVNYDLSATDTDGPAITFVQPADSVTVPDTMVEVHLTVSDPSGVRDGSVTVNGAVASPVGGQWHCTVVLTPGKNTLTAQAKDNSANANPSSMAITVFCDTSAVDEDGPLITPDQPQQGETVSAGTIDVIVSVSDVSGVAWVRLDGIDMTKGAGAKYSRTGVPLVPGENSLVVTAQDNAGNLDTLELVVTRDSSAVDTVPPVLSIDYPQSNARFKQDTVTVSGSAADNSGIQQVLVGGMEAAVAYPGWSVPYTLDHGHNTIVVQAFDNAGNMTESSVTVLHNQPPRFDSKSDDPAILDSNYTTTAYASDPDGDTLQFFQIDIPPDAQWQHQAAGVSIETFRPLKDSTYTFTFGVSDGWDTDTLTWAVHVSQGNRAPVFTDKPDSVVVRVNEYYTVQLTANDGDGDSLTMFLVGSTTPSSMYLSSGGTVVMTPQSGEENVYDVKAGVTDGTDTTFVEWHIVIVDNKSPRIGWEDSPPDTAANVNMLYMYTVDVGDPEGDSIGLDPADQMLPNGMNAYVFYDSAFGSWMLELSWTPLSGDTGVHAVEVCVSDTFGGHDCHQWTITVPSPVTAPSWESSIPALGAAPVSALAFTFTNILLAGTEGSSLRQFSGTWKPIGEGMLPDNISAIAVDQNASKVIVSGWSTQVKGIWYSDFNVNSWYQYSSLYRTYARSLVTVGGYVYGVMAGDSAGLFRVPVGGAQWERFEQGLMYVALTNLAVDEAKKELYVAAGSRVYLFRNGASQWDSLCDFGANLNAIDIQENGGKLFAAPVQVPVHTYDANADIFQQMTLPSDWVRTLFVSNASPTTVMVAYDDSTTHCSVDGGEKWIETADHLAAYAKCMTENEAGDIYAGFSNGEILVLKNPAQQ